MKKKTMWIAIVLIVLSLIHLGLSIAYVPLYAYFNVNDQLRLFVTGMQIFRGIMYLLILVFGYFALRKQKQRAIAFSLALFLFNLLLPFLFGL